MYSILSSGRAGVGTTVLGMLSRELPTRRGYYTKVHKQPTSALPSTLSLLEQWSHQDQEMLAPPILLPLLQSLYHQSSPQLLRDWENRPCAKRLGLALIQHLCWHWRHPQAGILPHCVFQALCTEPTKTSQDPYLTPQARPPKTWLKSSGLTWVWY
jgi:hypothetical protein